MGSVIIKKRVGFSLFFFCCWLTFLFVAFLNLIESNGYMKL